MWLLIWFHSIHAAESESESESGPFRLARAMSLRVAVRSVRHAHVHSKVAFE